MGRKTTVRFAKFLPPKEHLGGEVFDARSFYHLFGMREVDQVVEGTPLIIHLPPKKPDGRVWRCGTKWIWRMADEEVLRIFGASPPGGMYVCEHQIEMD